MKLPSLSIGELVARVPIIQGGMGVGVSRSRLASSVANEGGIGTISAVQIGFAEPDFETDNSAANIRGLKKEISKARKLSPKGILGVNILTAISNYKDMVRASVEEDIDLIVSGAGLPKDLPALIAGAKTKIVPIVSSGKAAMLIAKLWDRRYGRAPDLVVVEGPDAGGHLGFSMKELKAQPKPDLARIVKDVMEALRSFQEKYKKEIPVVVAGGIFNGGDIAKFLKMGAAGVQMATRFIATKECDADMRFKEVIINARKEDVQLIDSPVGMPGRAIRNYFIKTIEAGRVPVEKCYNCLKPCETRSTPYCISKALIRSVTGDTENGLVFAGSNAYRVGEMFSVKQLMNKLVRETEEALG